MTKFHICASNGIKKLSEVFKTVNASNLRAYGLGDRVNANFELETAEQVATLQKAGYDPQPGWRGMVMF